MLLRHSAIYLFARGLPGLVSFLTLMLYTRMLAPDLYGRYALVISAVGLGNSVLFAWLYLGFERHYPLHLEQPGALLAAARGLFARLVAVTGVLGGLAVLLCPDRHWRGIIALGLALVWAQGWLELNLVLRRCQLAPLRYGALAISRAVIATAAGYFLIRAGWGYYGALAGLALGLAVAAVAGARPWIGLGPGRVDRGLGRELFTYGAPLSLMFALQFIFSSSDRFLLSAMLGVQAAGLYAAGYDIATQSLGLIFVVLNMAAYPLAVRALELRGPESAREQVRANVQLFLVVGLPVTAGLCVLARNVGTVVLGAAFRDAAVMLVPLIALATFLSGLRTFYMDIAFQLGRYTLGHVWVALAAAIVNVALNLILIRRVGMIGAAYATVVAYATALVLAWRLGRRVFALPRWPGGTHRILLATVAMCLALLPLASGRGVAALALQFLVGVVAYGSAVVVLDIGGARARLAAIMPGLRR